MYDFLENNSIFVVLGIVMIIWFGIVAYLFIIDKKVTKLEKVANDSNPMS